MSQAVSQELLARLVSSLLEYERPAITGAALGVLIRKVVPELDVRVAVNIPVGTGALAKFVDMYLQHTLRPAGHTGQEGAGGDIIYEVLRDNGGFGGAASEGDDSEGGAFWTSFVRPSDRQLLAVTRANGSVRLHTGNELPPDGLEIKRVSVEDFQAISNAFLDQLVGSDSTRILAEQLRQAPTYAAFVQTLKEAGHFQKWSAHRRERLRAIFSARLASVGLSEGEQQELLLKLDRSTELARQKTRERTALRASVSLSGTLADEAASPTHDDAALARTLLKAIVDGMSLQEMRALQVPFGLALDATKVPSLKK
jgi:hypothetical protein